MVNAAPHSGSIGLDAIFQYTGSGVQFLFGSFFYIASMRLFSQYAVGAIVIFVAIIGLFNLAFSFGLSAAAQHFTSWRVGMGDYAGAKTTIYHIIMLAFVTSLVGFVSLLLMAPLLSEVLFHTIQFAIAIRLLSAVVVGNILFGVLNGCILGLQRFRTGAIISILNWSLYYIFALLFGFVLKSLDMLIMGWALGVSIGVGVELAFVLSDVRKYEGPGVNFPTRSLLTFSLPVLFSSVISYGASYADRFIVAGLMNLTNLAIYNIALLAAFSVGFLAVPFNNILLPKFSELYSRGDISTIRYRSSQAITLLSAIYLPCAIGVAILSPTVLQLLGGSAYVSGAPPLVIILVCSAVFISINVLSQGVAAIRKTRVFLWSSGIALVGNILFSFILIPIFGLIGAAVGYSSVFIATFTILRHYSRKYEIYSLNTVGIAKIWLATGIMALVVGILELLLGVGVDDLLMLILIGGVVYIGIFRSISVFKIDDVNYLLSLFPSKYLRFKSALRIMLIRRSIV